MLESEVDMNDHDEETLASLQQANDQLMAKNHALVKALSRATQEMTKTKAQLNQLAGPPMTFATMVRVHSAKTDEQGVQTDEVRLDIAKWDARQLEATINEYLVKPFIVLNWGVQKVYPRVCIRVPEPEDLKLLVDSLMPLIDRGMKVSESAMQEKFGLAAPKPEETTLQPLSAMQVQAVQPIAMNRQQPQRLAINRIQQPSEQAIEQLTDEAMSDWVEVGGEDFMNPLIELAKTATSFEEFNAGLLTLQETLGAETFTPQLADYLFRMRGMGDAQDA